MAYQSPALIEYVVDDDAYTVAAVGDWIDRFRTTGQQDLHESDGFMAKDAWFTPLGAATGEVSFIVERDYSAHADAQAAFLSPEVVDGADLVQSTGTLRMTIGGAVREWANAVLQSVSPALPSGPTSTVATAFRFIVPPVPAEA